MQEGLGSELEVLKRLGVALAIGLIIGLERGWRGAGRPEGGRVAGLRTFALVALVGALAELVSREVGAIAFLAIFGGVAALFVAGHVASARTSGDVGITTETAGLMTFALGALAMRGHLGVAVAVCVVATVILGVKSELHRFVARVEQRELYALFKLLVLSAVLLPVLPDRVMGPMDAWNPRELWWLIVLVAGVGFVGYFAVKLAGPRKGIGLAALAGGLVSSTAVTLSFSRMARASPALARPLAAGVLLSCTILFPRVAAIVAAVDRPLARELVVPLAAMAIVSLAVSVWLWRSDDEDGPGQPALELPNPVEVGKALQFGALLALIVLLAKVLQAEFGERGIYALAAISGMVDVDPIALSLARMDELELASDTAVRAIVLAIVANTLVKGVLAAVVAGGAMGRRVLGALLAVAAAGALTLALT